MATGSLTIKRGRYWAVISTYVETGTKRERRQQWIDLEIPAKGGKKAAKQKLNEVLLSFDDEQKLKSLTLIDVVSGYIQDAKDRVAPTTYNSYRYIFDGHIEPYFSKLSKHDLDSLSVRDINNYYNSLRKKGLSESTVAKHHQVLAAAFNQAFRDEKISTNVMAGVKHPTEDNYEVNFYDIDQLNVLLKVAKNSSIYTEILFAVFLGLRCGEILGLKWDSIDLENRLVKIHMNVTPARDDTGKETIFIREKMKTKKSVRNLILPESLTQYLQNLKAEQEDRKKNLGDHYNRNFEGFVCVDYTGRLHNPNYVTQTFKKVLRQNNLPDIRFHDLRHSCATMLLSLGFNMKAVQEQLGHTQYATTANTYAHVYDKTKHEIAAMAGSVLPIAN